MSLAPKLPAYPRKLILLSRDPQAASLLHDLLNDLGQADYKVHTVRSSKQLKDFELETICHGIFIDVRSERAEAAETLRHLGELRVGVALMAICADHGDLEAFKEVMHFLDDYIVSGHLVAPELRARTEHAIRRRLREQSLLHEQVLLQSLLDNVPDSIYFKDRESRFTKVNQRMIELFGQGQAGLAGKTDFDIFSEEHANAAFKDEQEIIRSGKSMPAKIEKETFEDGRVNWVHTTKLPLKDKLGRIIGTMGISRDITELKQTQDTLNSERILLKTIIDHALAGIFVKDREGRYRVVNRQHMSYLGASQEDEVIGRTLHDFVDPEEADRISQVDFEIMESGKALENLVDHRQRKGRGDFWILTNKVPLFDDNGKIIGLAGISLDITELKTTEAKLKSTIRLLEETRLQLIEAEKLKTVGRLAAGVAHEVKNPLNVISLGAEYLQKSIEGPEELLQVARDMCEAVGKASDVISELLDYSSPHAMRVEPANINELLKRVISLMRHNFNDAQVTVYEELSDSIEIVHIDTQKIEQVFINLFLNAIKAMPGGGELLIRTNSIRMQSTGANVSSELTELFNIGETILLIEILDSGSGLSSEAAKKAFDPFYSTASTGRGTGLGLSVCKSIVDMHHGRIALINRSDGLGACAQIFLPTVKN